MGSPQRFFSVLSAVLFLAVCAWFGAGLYSTAGAMQTAVLEYASVQDSAALQGIAIRSEQSLCFDRGFEAKLQDGKRISAGGELARGADGSSLICQSSAVFFTDCDGFEYLSPAALEPFTLETAQKLISAQPEDVGDARLVAGHSWYFAAVTDWSDALPSSGRCLVQFSGFEQSTEAEIISLSPQSRGKCALLLRLTEGGELLRMRKSDAKLLFSRYSGLVVPKKALCSFPGGGNFVYTLSAGAFKATEVDIIYRGDGYFLVEAVDSGELQAGSRIRIDPDS